MDIKEIYILKHELDKNIETLINEFCKKTDMTIESIKIENVYNLSSNHAIKTIINTKIVYEE